ncbi:hypothetical protein EUGRSUZ_H00312 [Eucalyptus grandis]|uniref:Uncharacterized protein n=2 Tax=Eucalyptus grandis TaxID=71139 RepID=A0ACC3JJM5_EUCGR|nr:hypothetical protein EUGRSUZ_H00312 [Eucalyptus grandis]
MATKEDHRQILAGRPAFPWWIIRSETKADEKARIMDNTSALKVDESRLRIDVGTRVRALPTAKVAVTMNLLMLEEASRGGGGRASIRDELG